MILDLLENYNYYLHLNKRFEKAFEFLLKPALKDLESGKYEIDGDRVFAIIAKEQGRKKEDTLLETHDKYIDIQLVLSGIDEMGWMPRALCRQISTKYDAEADIQFFKDTPDIWLSVKPGTFTIFFPEDAHQPMISSQQIHKVVVKVKMDS